MTNSTMNTAEAIKPESSSIALWRGAAIFLALVLVAVTAFVVGRGGLFSASPESISAAVGDLPASTQNEQSAEPEAAATSQTRPEADPQFAPSITDPQGLEILRAEARRDANDPRAIGKADAPVVLIEFTDYSCPMCTRFATETEAGLQELIDQGKLRIEYRDRVIFQQHGSDIAAAGGWAAAEQGKHSEYRKAVWEAAGSGHPEYTVDSVVEIAAKAGVPDLEKFRASVESAETRAKVDQETQHAAQIGIQGTPFVMINDAVVPGAYPIDFVKRTIEEQAKLVK